MSGKQQKEGSGRRCKLLRGGIGGIEPPTSRTLSENHTTRPNSLWLPYKVGSWSAYKAQRLEVTRYVKTAKDTAPHMIITGPEGQ